MPDSLPPGPDMPEDRRRQDRPNRRPARRPNEPRRTRRQEHPMTYFEREVIFRTSGALHVFDSVAVPVMRSLYATSVILRLIASEDQADKATAAITTTMTAIDTALDEERTRFAKLMQDNGITPAGLKVQAAQTVTVQITTPLATRFLKLITDVDGIIETIDILWLSAVFDDRQRHRAIRTLTGKLIAHGRDLQGIERRARLAARQRGQEDAVNSAVGAQTDELSDLPPEEEAPQPTDTAVPPVDAPASNTAENALSGSSTTPSSPPRDDGEGRVSMGEGSKLPTPLAAE